MPGDLPACAFGGAESAKDQADDQPGEQCAKQGCQRRAGGVFSEQGMKYFRNRPEKNPAHPPESIRFLRQRHCF